MAEKRKHPSQGRPLSVPQNRPDPDSPAPPNLEQAIARRWQHVPHVEATLAALLHGLNDADELVRVQAARGLLLAFPSAETALSRPLSDVESDKPEVRLAAIKRVITILTDFLAVLSGIKPDEPPITGRPPAHVMEDRMEHAGRWVARTRDRQRVLAVADSFADAMNRALAAGESDPYVTKAPGASPQPGRKPLAILEDESPNILDDVRKLFPDPDAWLDTPNDSLGGEKPRDLVRTEREWEVRYLLRAVEDGITT